MKRFLSLLLFFLLVQGFSIAETVERKWLWDICLTDPAESVIDRLEQVMDITFEKKEYSSGDAIYKTKDALSGVNIQHIPFGVYIRSLILSDQSAETWGVQEGSKMVAGIELSHENFCDNPSEEAAFFEVGVNNFKNLYDMLVLKFGEPADSFSKVDNGSVFGTYHVLDSEYPNQEKFICPLVDDINILPYKESGATYVSFQYSWGHVVLTGGFFVGESTKITFEIKESVGNILFASGNLHNDYFEYIEEKSIGIVSF